MKKLISIICVVCLCAVAFVACGDNKASLKDGTYRAEYTDFDEHGWKEYAVVTVKDGKISDVDFDSVNKDGGRKSENEAYREAMEPVANTYPGKFYPELEAQLKEKQDPAKIETVAGATVSTNAAKELAKALVSNMQNGDTATVTIARSGS